MSAAPAAGKARIAAEDLLTSPRHSLPAKVRRWLSDELRRERKALAHLDRQRSQP